MTLSSSNKLLVSAVFGLLACMGSWARSDVQEINIYCHHSGWVSKESFYTVKKAVGGFEANGQKVADDLIDNLMRAVSAPVIPELNFGNLGITAQWVEANAPLIIDRITSSQWGRPLRNCSDRQKDFFRRQVHKLSTIEKVIKAHYGPIWTDDYSEISVEISLDSGHAIRLRSRGQKQFMIPWLLSRDWYSSAPYKTATCNTPTYNADICRAIADLMPDGYLHRSRLDGELVKVLADDLWMELTPEMSTMMVSETLGGG